MAANQCFAIFEGGGVKGLAHLGALKAMEDVGLETTGVAGTSAGAIIAALAAVGFKADELIDTVAHDDILSRRGLGPIDLLGRSDWTLFKKVKVRWVLGLLLYFMPVFASVAAFAMSQLTCRPRVFSAFWRLLDHLGFFSTEPARDLLDQLLKEKLFPNPVHPPLKHIRFKDIDPLVRKSSCRLKIIATNLSQGSLQVFSGADDPGDPQQMGDVIVADAVAASFSIPFFFKPTRVRRCDDGGNVSYLPDSYADGGLISNLPVWAFLEDKRIVERAKSNSRRPPIPIAAFSLDPESKSPVDGNGSQWAALAAYARSVVGIGIFGGQSLVRVMTPNLTIISLRTTLNVLDFDCSRDTAERAFDKGRADAVTAMRRDFKLLPLEPTSALKDLLVKVRQRSDALRVSDKVLQFRASLIARDSPLSFKVVAAAGMEDDADDNLLLDRNNPGAPRAFKERRLIVLDLKGAPGDLLMTKYERALVRPTLATVICIPIFSSIDEWSVPAENRGEPAGVVCVDSDTDLGLELQQSAFRQMLQTETIRFWKLMKPGV